MQILFDLKKPKVFLLNSDKFACNWISACVFFICIKQVTVKSQQGTLCWIHRG